MNQRQEHLEENLVADSLGSVIKKVEPYSKLILAIVVAVVLGLLALGLYTSGQTAKRSDATFQLLMNDEDIASKYPETAAAAWSMLFEADENLAQGINSLYEDRGEAENLLGQAKEQFADAAKASDNTVLRSRASYGMAIASESLGQVDEAKAAYEKTIAINESEQMVEVAKERLERLEKPSTTEFFTWFAAQDFAPADPSLPPELPGAGSLPDLPDLDLPALDLGDDLKASDEPMTKPENSDITVPDSETVEATEKEMKEAGSEAGSAIETPAEEAETKPETTEEIPLTGPEKEEAVKTDPVKEDSSESESDQ